ncbi:hypothetical protein CUJ91_22855 [Paraburkholderia graminis]|nr:hypothetical protein AC233_20580 [Burkholderia sp. HB1]AXF10781.1 hypothetical protein CUJ91_22855 [Paraburkholderia graminis]
MRGAGDAMRVMHAMRDVMGFIFLTTFRWRIRVLRAFARVCSVRCEGTRGGRLGLLSWRLCSRAGAIAPVPLTSFRAALHAGPES